MFVALGTSHVLMMWIQELRAEIREWKRENQELQGKLDRYRENPKLFVDERIKAAQNLLRRWTDNAACYFSSFAALPPAPQPEKD